MTTFILILTLVIDSGNGGQGGVAMQEFTGLQSCQSAGEAWLRKVNRWGKHSFYLCQKRRI